MPGSPTSWRSARPSCASSASSTTSRPTTRAPAPAKSTCATRSKRRSRPRPRLKRPRRRRSPRTRVTRTRSARSAPRAARAPEPVAVAVAVVAAAVGAGGAKSSRRPSTTAKRTATASGSTPRSRTTPSTPSPGPASATPPSASRPTRSSSAAPARAATTGAAAGTTASPSPTTRTSSSDLQFSSAGEVRRAPEVEPEGCVAEGLRLLLDRRRDVDRHLLAPVGALAVELGQLAGAEGRPDPPPQLLPDRVDHPVGQATPPRVLDRLKRSAPLLPLEERVLERVRHWPRLPRRPRRQSGHRRVGDVAQRGVAGATGARVERAADLPDGDLAFAEDRADRPFAPQPTRLRRGDRVARVEEVEEGGGDEVVELG